MGAPSVVNGWAMVSTTGVVWEMQFFLGQPLPSVGAMPGVMMLDAGTCRAAGSLGQGFKAGRPVAEHGTKTSRRSIRGKTNQSSQELGKMQRCRLACCHGCGLGLGQGCQLLETS